LYMGKSGQGQQIKQLSERIQHDVENLKLPPGARIVRSDKDTEGYDDDSVAGSQIANHSTTGQHVADGDFKLSSGRKASPQVQKFLSKYRRYSAPITAAKKSAGSPNDHSQHQGSLRIKLPEALMLKPEDALANLYNDEAEHDMRNDQLMSPHKPKHYDHDCSRESYTLAESRELYNLADKDSFNMVEKYLTMLTDRSSKVKRLGSKQWRENDDSDAEAVSKRSESGAPRTPSVLSDFEGDNEDVISVLSDVI